MPIYEYKCAQCGRVGEFLVGVGSEDTELKCRHCGSEELVKMISASFVAKSEGVRGAQHGTTCCGRDERCDKPPCSDEGICQR